MSNDQLAESEGLQDAQRRERGERGASLVEYALLLALIAAVCIGALTFFGSSNGAGLNRSSSCISAASNGDALPQNCP